MDDPAWHVTRLFGTPAALSHHDGRWSVVVESGCSDGASLDEALFRALRGRRTDRNRGASRQLARR